MASITRCRAGVSVSTPFELMQVRQKNRVDKARGREVINEAREKEVMDVKRELQAELESAREVIRGLEMGLESESVEGKGKGQRKREEGGKEYEVRVCSFWDRWGVCLGFGMFLFFSSSFTFFSLHFPLILPPISQLLSLISQSPPRKSPIYTNTPPQQSSSTPSSSSPSPT